MKYYQNVLIFSQRPLNYTCAFIFNIYLIHEIHFYPWKMIRPMEKYDETNPSIRSDSKLKNEEGHLTSRQVKNCENRNLKIALLKLLLRVVHKLRHNLWENGQWLCGESIVVMHYSLKKHEKGDKLKVTENRYEVNVCKLVE